MSKSKKTEQELHVEAELAHFEAQGKSYRCRGVQEQDIGAVVAKIEQSKRLSERAAARATTEEDKVRHEVNAAQADELAGLVLEAAACLQDGKGSKRFGKLPESDFADQPVDGELGRVRIGRVIAVLIASGSRGQAQTLDKIARVPCGADLGPTIAALPRPCESEPYVCPKCGREGHVSKTAHASAEA